MFMYFDWTNDLFVTEINIVLSLGIVPVYDSCLELYRKKIFDWMSSVFEHHVQTAGMLVHMKMMSVIP